MARLNQRRRAFGALIGCKRPGLTASLRDAGAAAFAFAGAAE